MENGFYGIKYSLASFLLYLCFLRFAAESKSICPSTASF